MEEGCKEKGGEPQNLIKVSQNPKTLLKTVMLKNTDIQFGQGPNLGYIKDTATSYKGQRPFIVFDESWKTINGYV